MLLIYFIFGTIFASFSYVVALRLPLKQDFVKSRSQCDYCYHSLNWYDLVPIISYLMLRGKCRYCHHEISITHFLMELFGGLCLVTCHLYARNGLVTLGLFALNTTMMIIALIDQDYMLIPDSLIIVTTLLCLYLFVVERKNVVEQLNALLIPLMLYLMTLIHPNSFGEGDLMLLCPLCFYLGFKDSFNLLLLSSILGSLAGIKILYEDLNHDHHLPFVPMLTIGLILTIFVL